MHQESVFSIPISLAGFLNSWDSRSSSVNKCCNSLTSKGQDRVLSVSHHTGGTWAENSWREWVQTLTQSTDKDGVGLVQAKTLGSWEVSNSSSFPAGGTASAHTTKCLIAQKFHVFAQENMVQCETFRLSGLQPYFLFKWIIAVLLLLLLFRVSKH
jgi:hypothetical protein